jgi:hypothetical protein
MTIRVRPDVIFPASLILCLGIAAITFLGIDPTRRDLHAAAQITLRVMLFGFCGVGGLAVGLVHLFREEAVAAAIGWPARNPFHYEVAVANLAFGVLGILTRWAGPEFWTAVAIGVSVFIGGAGVIHLDDLVRRQNRAVLNAGAVLWVDFLAAGIIIGALLAFHLT